jgi:hypothetical protein
MKLPLIISQAKTDENLAIRYDLKKIKSIYESK